MKEMFSHFTSDSMPFAKQIVSFEREIEGGEKEIKKDSAPKPSLLVKDQTAPVKENPTIASPPAHRLAPQSEEAHQKSLDDLPFIITILLSIGSLISILL